MAVRIAELEAVFTGNIEDIQAKAKRVQDLGDQIDNLNPNLTVEADVRAALASLDGIEAEMDKLDGSTSQVDVLADAEKALAGIDDVSDLLGAIDGETSEVQVTADTSMADRGLSDVDTSVQALDGVKAELQVTADTGAADRNLSAVDTAANTLNGKKAELQVSADTSAAQKALDDIEAEAAAAGESGGEGLAEGVADGVGKKGDLISTAIKVALGVSWVGAGIGIGKGLLDGMQQEVRGDRLMAQTGLDEKTAARVATAAGNAYAANFGESVASNMDVARTALQSGLIDPKATEQDMQSVINSVTGVADVLEEDVNGVIRSTEQLMRTGLAKSAEDAFDIIVAGQQSGLNVSEDWLDTINEYSTQFRNLGLDAPEALGLMQQAVQAGARDTDVAADALKEFSIRARDLGDVAARKAFEDLGFSADEMQGKVAGGGDSAVSALDDTLDALRKIEDPAKRNAAAVALFGTQAEDMGAALYAMDLDTAGDKFEDLGGRAERALTTLGESPAAKIETAKRSIELSAEGIKGALAGAFADPLAEGADWVTSHQGDITAAVSTIGDMTFHMVETGLTGFASMSEAIGGFIGGPVAELVGSLGDAALAFDSITPGDQHGQAISAWADEQSAGLRKLGEDSEGVADTIREDMLPGISEMRDGWGEATADMVENASLSDATVLLADTIAGVGVAADGSEMSLKGMTSELDMSTGAGRLLDEQARAVSSSLVEQAGAAARNGESQDQLAGRVENARQAFIDQAVGMGMPQREAEKLADRYGLIPDKVLTELKADDEASAKADRVDGKVRRIPKTKTTNLYASDYASSTLDRVRRQVVNLPSEKTITVTTNTRVTGDPRYSRVGGQTFADGGVVDYYADGGVENHVAQIAPAGAWRVWAEDETGGEAYIPLSPAKRGRSMAILDEVASRFGATLTKRANGAVDGGPALVSTPGTVTATLAPEDRALLRAVVDRPVAVSIDRREFATAVASATAYGTRRGGN